MNKIVILGGSGFVGSALILKLLEKNYEVLNLDRAPSRIQNPKLDFVQIDLMNEEIDSSLLENTLAIVNLAGIPIFGRFTEKYKADLRFAN